MSSILIPPKSTNKPTMKFVHKEDEKRKVVKKRRVQLVDDGNGFYEDYYDDQ